MTVYRSNKKIITMKKLLISAFAILSLMAVSCTKTNDQILVRYHNTLESDLLDSRHEFDEENITTIGDLAAGETSEYIAFDYFQVGDVLPMGFVRAMENGEPIDIWSGLWCGTGVEFKQLEPGKYTIELQKIETPSGPFYQMVFAD